MRFKQVKVCAADAKKIVKRETEFPQIYFQIFKYVK